MLVKQPEYDEALEIALAVRRWSTTAARLLDGVQTEQSIFWTDERTGIECKARVDASNPRYRALIDIKSTVDASYEGFRRACRQYRYDIQDGYYRDGYPMAGGFEVEAFIFIAIQKSRPYLTGVYSLEPEDVAKARDDIRRLLDRYAECDRTGKWPGYLDAIQALSLNLNDRPQS
jgi:hypothetical protein